MCVINRKSLYTRHALTRAMALSKTEMRFLLTGRLMNGTEPNPAYRSKLINTIRQKLSLSLLSLQTASRSLHYPLAPDLVLELNSIVNGMPLSNLSSIDLSSTLDERTEQQKEDEMEIL